MEDLSLHILDVVENSIAAKATVVTIGITEDVEGKVLTVTIDDDGVGMDEAGAARALDPFFTTRTTRRVGLGLPMLAQSARETGGGLQLRSAVGEGTRVTAKFHTDHPDCRPVGDLNATLATLVAGHPEVRFICQWGLGGDTTRFDTADLDEAPPA